VLDVLTFAALAFVGVRLFGGTRLMTRPDVRAHVLGIVRGLRWRHFLLCWPVLLLVLVAANFLLLIPGLSWGWWSAIGGVGSPVLGVSKRSSGSPLEFVVPVVFAAMLLPALPLFAEAEERRFRAGAEHWSTARRLARAMQFGLIHCLIGIPIGVGGALSIGGLYFTWAYLRGYRRGDDLLVDPERDDERRRANGVLESTRAHLAYNITIFVVIGVTLAVVALA
jgi:hypothetical protein